MKTLTFRSKKFLAYVRTLPCCICGRTETVVAHHVEGGGVGMKCSDALAIPLCFHHHVGDEGIHRGKKTFFKTHNTTPEKELMETMKGFIERA